MPVSPVGAPCAGLNQKFRSTTNELTTVVVLPRSLTSLRPPPRRLPGSPSPLQAMDRTHHLGALQHAIMRVLWAAGEASVADVHRSLTDPHQRALTTIATMLMKLEKKGVVEHRTEGRQFVYRPTVSEVEVRRSMVAELTDRLFAGDAAQLVNHLVDERALEAGELDALAERVRVEAERRAAPGAERKGGPRAT